MFNMMLFIVVFNFLNLKLFFKCFKIYVNDKRFQILSKHAVFEAHTWGHCYMQLAVHPWIIHRILSIAAKSIKFKLHLLFTAWFVLSRQKKNCYCYKDYWFVVFQCVVLLGGQSVIQQIIFVHSFVC